MQKPFVRRLGGLALAASLVLSASLAQAAFELPEFPTVAGHASGVPVGGQAMTSLRFDFPAGYAFTGLDLLVAYDANFLKLNAEASTLAWGSTVFTYQDLLAEQGNPASLFFITVGNDTGSASFASPNPGMFSLSAQYMPPPLPLPQSIPIPAGSSLVLHGVFDLRPSFVAGMSQPVSVLGELAYAGGSDMFTNTINIAAVPEPETWLMLLGGLGLIASRLRRKPAAQAA